MFIGELSRRCGIAASALRYYEREGLMTSPLRSSTRRLYDAQAIGRVRIIKLARDAGFSISEIRAFLCNPSDGRRPSSRWQQLADKKTRELDAQIAELQQMKSLLATSFKCRCKTITVCETLMQKRQAP